MHGADKDIFDIVTGIMFLFHQKGKLSITQKEHDLSFSIDLGSDQIDVSFHIINKRLYHIYYDSDSDLYYTGNIEI